MSEVGGRAKQPRATYRPNAGTDHLEWVIAAGQTAQYPDQLRFCKIPTALLRSQYPTHLNIFWSMARPRPDGLASAEDVKHMQVFEERIVAAVEQPKIAVLPMILAGRGEREFVFYTRSPEEFRRP